MRTVILFCLQAEQSAGLFNAVKPALPSTPNCSCSLSEECDSARTEGAIQCTSASSSGRVTTSSVASCSAAQHFTVEQLVQIDAGDAGLAAQDQAALVGAAALGDHRIRQTEKLSSQMGLSW